MRTLNGSESILAWIMSAPDREPDLSVFDDIQEDDVVLGTLSPSAKKLLAIEQAVDDAYERRRAEVIENDSLKEAKEFNIDLTLVGEFVIESIRGLLCAQVMSDLLAAGVDSELFAEDFIFRSDGSVVTFRADALV